MGCFAEVDCVTVLPITVAVTSNSGEENNDALCSGKFFTSKMFVKHVYSLPTL